MVCVLYFLASFNGSGIEWSFACPGMGMAADSSDLLSSTGFACDCPVESDVGAAWFSGAALIVASDSGSARWGISTDASLGVGVSLALLHPVASRARKMQVLAVCEMDMSKLSEKWLQCKVKPVEFQFGSQHKMPIKSANKRCRRRPLMRVVSEMPVSLHGISNPHHRRFRFSVQRSAAPSVPAGRP